MIPKKKLRISSVLTMGSAKQIFPYKARYFYGFVIYLPSSAYIWISDLTTMTHLFLRFIL